MSAPAAKRQPAVVRLPRRVLSGLVAVGVVLIFGGLIVALYQGNRRPGDDCEPYNTDNKITPDGLSACRGTRRLPPAQAAIRRPPPSPLVPGDLGRPVSGLRADADTDQQRLAQENEAARTSHLFTTTGTRERPAAPEPAASVADQKLASPGQPGIDFTFKRAG